MKLSFKNFRIYSFIAFLLFTVGNNQDVFSQQQDDVIVRFQDNGELLKNPGKGFMAFQVRTDGELHEQNYQNYPNAAITYFRVYWRHLEPEQGVYRWELIDRALESAREREQTVMIAVVSYGSSGLRGASDVPEWYRDMVGDRTEWAHNNPTHAWLVDAEDPRYNEYFGGFIRKMGERYDGHPDVEGVDTRIVGAWGEGAGSSLPTQPTREALINAYTDSFKKTPLIMLLTDEKTNKYGLSQADVGWRADCMGDLGFWAEDQFGWNHMFDYYPQGIINYGMEDAWKKGHVSLEICGTFNTWKDREGYTREQVEYIFEQGLKWRMSSFNAKSAPVPEEWQDLVDDWIKKMGYRFVPRRVSYSREVSPNGILKFTTWWENKGVAPIYKQFPLAFRLKNSNNSVVLITDADIREWMPGDILYDDAVYIPHDLPAGEYDLDMALIEQPREAGAAVKPGVKLPVDGRTVDNWYSLGKITVSDNNIFKP